MGQSLFNCKFYRHKTRHWIDKIIQMKKIESENRFISNVIIMEKNVGVV